MSRLRSLLFAAPIFVTLCATLFSQAFNGSLVGTVTDASSAAVTGASVTATSNSTGERRTASTDSDGSYRFVNLIPGRYKLEVEHAGFKRYSRDQIEVNVDSTIRADVGLAVGEVTQSVEVTAQAALLQSENAALGQVVSTRSVEDLPLNGRNVLNLINTAPGVVPQGSSEGSLTGKNVFAAGNYQIGGGTANQSATYYDGVAVNIPYGNLVALVPSADTVAEFRVQTSSLSAEFGRYTGGVVNMASKSGTNEFHGSAYEYLRNKVLNAGTFFANSTGAGKPAFVQNQFGAAVGGPIKKNKIFFFAGYEGYRQRQAVLFLNTVPSLEKLRGDFSNYRNAAGAVIPIYDPQTQCGTAGNPACPATGPQRSVFPNNKIPDNRINAIARNYVNFPYWGAPNVPGQNFTQLFNFSRNVSTGGDNDQVNVRGDYSVTDKNRLLLRYTRWKSVGSRVDVYNNGLYNGDPYSPERFVTTQAVLGDTYMISPNTVLDVRLGFTRWFYDRTPGTLGLDIPKVTGLPSYYNTLDSLNGLSPSVTIPQMNVTGYNTIATGLLYGVTNNYTASPSLTWIKGRHTLKFGMEFRNLQLNYYQNNNAGGFFTFSNLFTSQNAVSSGATGEAFASFLLGLPASGTVQTSLFTATGLRYQGYYVNDSFQVTNRLTLNMGVRWEIPGTYTERFDRQATFDRDLINPVLAKAGVTVNGQPVKGAFVLVGTEGHPERGLRPERYKLFAPRIGIAYRLSERTVLRTGGGIFYIPADSSFPEAPLQSAVNYINNDMVASIDNQVTPLNTLTNPYPNGFTPPPQRGTNFQQLILGTGSPRSPQRSERYGYTGQWNLAVQHQLPHSIALEATYAGLRGVHLPRGNPSRQLSAIDGKIVQQLGSKLSEQVENPFYGIITAGALAQKTVQRGQLLRPFPQYLSNIDFGGYIGNSIYHSLQTKVEKRFGSGGTLLAAYTFSKLISDTETITSWLEGGTGGTGAAGVQDYTNLRAERALSSFDSRRRFTLSYVIDLPFGRGKHFMSSSKGFAGKVVGGWAFNGLFTFQDGFPLALTATPNLTGLDTGLRPNVIAGCDPVIDGPVQARLSRAFNTSCYSVPASYTFGGESRTDPVLRGNGTNNIDMAVTKRTSITERVNMEFRLEAFNATNRVKFSNPNTAATTAANGTFGVISSQANSPRLLQMALRLRF
ncbi:MAG: carboxypeptidase regulatory-like domain-containing protein [Candidatus Solibacter sp.]